MLEIKEKCVAQHHLCELKIHTHNNTTSFPGINRYLRTSVKHMSMVPLGRKGEWTLRMKGDNK